MGTDDVPLDDKAKRMRDLLSSFYSHDHSASSSIHSKSPSLDAINTSSFHADQYMNLLVQRSNLEGLLQKHVEMAAEIKNLDTDLQMLVYENYSKFISATDTIKRMKSNIIGMEANMEQLLDKIMSVQSRSDIVNTSLFEKREHIEKLNRTRNLLRKVQFIYDLPARLGKCIKTEAYADAVKFYTGAMPIFKIYGDTSFLDCKRASEEAMATVLKNLQGKLFSDSESIQARVEAAVLLKQLDFPVNSLKTKLLEKLEQSLEGLEFKTEEITTLLDGSNDPLNQEDNPELTITEHDAHVREFAEAVRAFKVIFADSEDQLIRLSKELITKHFEITEQCIKKGISVGNFLAVSGIIWSDVLLMEEVLPEALLPDYSLKASKVAVKQYIASEFSNLLRNISDALQSVKTMNKDERPLHVTLDAGKNAVLQGSMDVLLNLRKLLADSMGLLARLNGLIMNWVQEGFQDFFKTLDNRFLMLSGRNTVPSQDHGLTEGCRVDKVPPGLVLVLAQLSLDVERTVIPRITEEMAAIFSGGGIQGYKNGPAFVPAEICCIFRSAGEKFLHDYINMRTHRVSVLLRKRFTTPNWIKHKEPREVHMFVDLFLQELEATGTEVNQILPRGLHRKPHRTDSNGSTASSRSNPFRDDKLTRSNIQRARSQLLETHLAKLFEQKVEIFTKIEHTQESVVSTVVKLCLKSLQEFVRLQTFNRSGFQQIQVDIQFLRSPLKDIVGDEAAIDFLLDEVIVGASERCLDTISLEPPILEKLIQAKLAKTKEQSPISP